MVCWFEEKGYAAYRVTWMAPDHEIWFRVRVGAFKDCISSSPTLDRLKQDQKDAFL
ncbi:hypothetical protein JCM14469_01010 [Desulfatiferula olefinivorans]